MRPCRGFAYGYALESSTCNSRLFFFLGVPGFTGQSLQESPSVLFRDYALAVCVADGYTSGEIKVDASAVASGYLEKGSYPLEAYNEVRELGRKFLTKNYPSISNTKLTLMKCIDFSEVDRVIRKYQKQGQPSKNISR